MYSISFGASFFQERNSMKKTILKTKRIAFQCIHPVFTRPTSGRLIITSNCPLRCKMCTFWHNKHTDPSLELIKFWIEEMADFGIKEIAIGGGEPFVRKDLPEIAEKIRSYGMLCSITTSGYLIGKAPFPPVDECVISIDGAKPETHDKIRGVKGSWEKAINAVKIAKKHCVVKQLNFVLQKDNYHELVDFCRLAKQLEVPVVLIPISLKLAAQSPISKTLKEFDIKRLKELLNEAIAVGNISYNKAFVDLFLSKIEKGERRQQCMAPYHCILIFSNGDIYPCGNLDTAVGNLSQGKHLKDLYKKYGDMRKEIWSGLHPFCSKCIYPDILNRKILRSGIGMFVRERAKLNILHHF